MKRGNQYNRRTTAAAAAAAAEDNSNDSSTTDQSNDLLSDTADDSLLMPPPPSNNKRKGGDTTTDIDTQGIIGSSTELISNNTSKKKKTSLFSAVISRSSSNKSKFNNNAHKKQSIATSTKPSSLADATSNKMSTPTKTLINNSSKSSKRSPMHSPGGYEILQALDSANLYAYNNNQQDNEGEEEDGTTTAQQHTKDTEGKDEFHDANVYFHKSTAASRRSGYDDMGTTREKKRETKEDLSSLFLDSSIVEATRQGTYSTTSNHLKRGVGSNVGSSSVPVSVGMIDWSIKRRLRLDCIPGNCLPGSSMNGGMKGGLNEGKVRQLAIQQLSSSIDTSSMERSSASYSMRATSEEEMAASKWLASTMYYQHPAVHPLPLSMLVVDSSSSSTSTAGGKKGDGGRKDGKGDLSSYILQPQSVHNKVRLSDVGSMGGLGLSNLPLTNDKDKSILGNQQQRRERNTDKASVSTVSSLLYQRRRDWQECFRSLFQLWKSKLKEIDRSSSSTTASSQQDLISRNSFYIISSNQIVLFRCGYMKQHSGDISPQLVPMVVFSSTTPYLRSKLKSMGVELRLFTSKSSDTTTTSTEEEGSYEVFTESLLETNNDTTPTQEDSAEVHAELNAIKHADDEKGKVTVEVKKRKVRPRYNDLNNSNNGSKGSSLPPLFVYGIDDCNVVYELFMNTYGLSSVDNQTAGMSSKTTTTTNATVPVSDIPLLLCRSLGSNCLHTTLRTLSVSSRRDTGFMNQVYHQDQQQQRHHSSTAANAKATLELRGPILPCALRDLTCAAINLMLLDKKSRRQQGKHQDLDFLQRTNNKNDMETNSSSHQFAMFLQVHEGESSTSMSKMTTGSSSSVNFNGSNISLMPSQEEEGEDDHNNDASSWYECRQGDCINVLVWDVSRTSVVSFHPTEA